MFNKTLNHKKTSKNNKKTNQKRNKTPIKKSNAQDKPHSQTQTVNVYTHGHYQRRTNTQR